MQIELRTNALGDKFPVFIDIPGREEYRLVTTGVGGVVFAPVPVATEE
jgi:hypothetical protein